MDYGWIICCIFVIYTHWWLCCLVKVNIIFFTFFPRLLAWHKSDIFYPPPPHTYSFAGIMPDRVATLILLQASCLIEWAALQMVWYVPFLYLYYYEYFAPSSFPKKITKFKKYIYLY